MPEIRIIHTSDFHDRLTARKAARLRALKEERGALLIDTGDAVCAPNVAVMPWRERAISLMNAAGYDAMGLGNREYFFRLGGMMWKTGHARFVRVCSNLVCARPGVRRTGIPPAAVLVSPRGRNDAREGRVGFLALMPTMIAPGHWFEKLSDTRFVPWQEAARLATSSLRGRVDIIVAGFHRPPEEIPELIALCPEIAFVLAGHAHTASPGLDTNLADRPVSFVGEGASHARIIGLNSMDGAVTMDRLVDLSEAGP